MVAAMKNIFIILIFSVLPLAVVAQQYDYAKLMGGVAGNAYSQGVVTDNVGNVYMKGTFSGSQQIGSAIYRTTGTDSYICKNDASGNLIWYKSVGFDEAEDGTWQPGNIAIDVANNIYITGYFSGDQNIEGTSLSSNGSTDIYVIKYDQNGNFQWAEDFGTAGFDAGLSITVDGSQNVYIGGLLATGNTITFGSIPYNTSTTFNTEFIAKFKADGSEDWLQLGVGEGGAYEDLDFSDATNSLFAVGSIDTDLVYKSVHPNTGIDNWIHHRTNASSFSIARGIKSFGTELYITGSFNTGDINFPNALAPLILNHTSGNDIFLVSVDSAGSNTTYWGREFGGTNDEVGTDVDIDPATGGVYITGNYSSPDLTLMGVAMPQAASSGSPFLAYADGSGNDVTALAIPTVGQGTGTGLALSSVAGTLFTSGFYHQRADFGTKVLNQKNSTFYVGSHKLSNLNNNWVNSAPKGEIVVEYMVVDNNDNLFLGGYFDGTIDVMGTTIISSEITTDATLPRNDLFVAKMRPDESLDWIQVAGGLDADTLRGITYDGEGAVYLNARFTNVATIAGIVPDVSGKVIVKLEAAGDLVYAYQVDLPPNSDITAIQGDNDVGADSLYMGGYYNGTAFFQGNPTNGSNLTDVFLVALDGNGSVIPSQVTSHGGETNEWITDMHKLPGGQLHITGWSNSPNNLAFDGLDLPIGVANGTDIFVVRFDDTLFENGGFIDGGTDDQEAQHITLDGLGNIIIAGELFDEGTFGGTALDLETSYNSFFIASYSDPFGTLNFAKEMNDWGGVSGSLSDLAADGAGNVFLAGEFSIDLSFGGAGSVPMITALGQTDGFLAKWDVAGSFDFAEAYGGNHTNGAESFKGFDYGLAMAVNSSNELWYSGTLTLLAETFGPFTLQPYSSVTPGQVGGMDSYLLRLGSGAAASPNPKVYWTEETGNQINRSNLDGSSFEQYYSGFSIFPQGLALDTTNNKIYWSDTNGQVKRGDIGPATIENIEVLVDKSFSSQRTNGGVALDIPNGKLYWVETWNDAIWSANLDGSSPAQIVSIGSPIDIGVDGANGKIYYTADTDVIVANTDGTGPTSIYSSAWIQYGLDLVTSIGKIIWVEDDEGIFRIHSADLDGSNRVEEFSDIEQINDVALDALNSDFYFTSPSNPGIGVFDGSGTNYIQTNPNVNKPISIALEIPPLAGCASPPTANAGADATWCSSDTRAVSGSRGGSATSTTWTTSGDGTFANPTNQFTDYTLGANDIINGTVTLTITTDDPDGAGPCLPASDDIIITIEAAHTVVVGPDQTVCQGDDVNLTGTIGGSALTASWSIRGVGDGSFDDANSLTAIYTPGPTDIANGSVNLELWTDPTTGCSEENDEIIITISKPIIAADQIASLNVTETTIIDVTNGATIGPGDIITTTLLTQPQKGTTVINGDGSISYTALTGTVGDDIFDYKICNQCILFCDSAQIIITIINVPPVVDVPPSTIIAGGVVIINVLTDISDDNDNLDLTSLKITIQPQSGALASLDASGNLTVDYSGLKFAGTDQLTIEICDLDGLCTTEVITIEVEPPGVIVYNAVSPNGDDKHPYLEIENAEFFLENQVKIMNRWGDIIYQVDWYNNDSNKFIGVANKNGSGELPSGTYYYNIVLGDGSKPLTGFFSLRR